MFLNLLGLIILTTIFLWPFLGVIVFSQIDYHYGNTRLFNWYKEAMPICQLALLMFWPFFVYVYFKGYPKWFEKLLQK